MSSKPQYYGVYNVIYINTYGEPRSLIISANNDSECKDILLARGIKALAYFEIPEMIRNFNNKHDKRKDKN